MSSYLRISIALLMGIVLGVGGHALWSGDNVNAQESQFAYTKIRHVGMAFRDLDKAASMLEQLGFKKVRVNPKDRPNRLYDQSYHGKPDEPLLWQGQWRGEGDTTIELLSPLGGNSDYSDFLEDYGEGIHHLCFMVPDMDKEIAKYKEAGWEVLQQGKWPMEEGYGAYAYLKPKDEKGPVFELVTRVPWREDQ